MVGPELPFFSLQPMNVSGALLSFSSYHLQVSHSESVFAVRGKAVLYVTLTFLGFSLLPDADPADFHLLVKTLMHLNSF